MKHLLDYCERIASEHLYYKGGAWCYEDGLIYRGLCELHKATGDEKWLSHLIRLIDKQIDPNGYLAGYNPNDYNIDNIQPGRSLLYLHKTVGENRYLRAAEHLMEQLRTHPRTKSGVYWHKLRYPWQIWLDGLYMGHPFQIEFGKVTNDQELVLDGINQVATALEETFVEETGLYAHAFDEAKKQRWADAETGHPKAHWARALGWVAMSLVDIAELTTDEEFEPLHSQTVDLLEKISGFRTSNGLWLQVIDQPQLEGNFEESSASAMFVYALNKAERLGVGDEKPISAQGLFNSVLSCEQNGSQAMTGICHVAGLGKYQDRYRDGTAEYYVSEKCVNDDPKGVGPLMNLVALELLR
ncbi:glycoside hydrolase family 88/105 protein [Maritalea porphyrae]|uniref:Family 88 glycosyl hydrolase n=1 Tax=Maritalea porphyrae TaxID=880732 RepID=A0ABQ5UMK4_9HYPH|nr:glycoside hydrolase family 88 protein [Maritalea porphyrae]GLQ16530.1 family 88 glycosyl hydrolase [Maritalea porphyrae]